MKNSARPVGTAAVLDVETTGLSHSLDQVIELAIALFRFDRTTGEVLEVISQYSGLREPSCPISSDAGAIHGITLSMVRGRDLDHGRIGTMLEQAEFIVAHNARFDRGFVEPLIPSARKALWRCSCWDIDWRAKGFSRRSLEALAGSHRIGNPQSHRAAGDIETLLALLSHRPSSSQSYLYELLSSGQRHQPGS
jgi:DNA polymerase-3 subunit epsilon